MTETQLNDILAGIQDPVVTGPDSFALRKNSEDSCWELIQNGERGRNRIFYSSEDPDRVRNQQLFHMVMWMKDPAKAEIYDRYNSCLSEADRLQVSREMLEDRYFKFFYEYVDRGSVEFFGFPVTLEQVGAWSGAYREKLLAPEYLQDHYYSCDEIDGLLSSALLYEDAGALDRLYGFLCSGNLQLEQKSSIIRGIWKVCGEAEYGKEQNRSLLMASEFQKQQLRRFCQGAMSLYEAMDLDRVTFVAPHDYCFAYESNEDRVEELRDHLSGNVAFITGFAEKYL